MVGPSDIQNLVEQSVADGMAIRSVTVPSYEVVYFKGVVEANEGVAQVYAQPRPAGSAVAERLTLTVVSAANGTAELDRLLADLADEIECVIADGQSEWSQTEPAEC